MQRDGYERIAVGELPAEAGQQDFCERGGKCRLPIELELLQNDVHREFVKQRRPGLVEDGWRHLASTTRYEFARLPRHRLATAATDMGVARQDIQALAANPTSGGLQPTEKAGQAYPDQGTKCSHPASVRHGRVTFTLSNRPGYRESILGR